METMASVAVPEEDGYWTVHSSAQGPASIRNTLAGVLQTPASRINVVTKRAGGGFGGKIMRSHPIAAAVTVAAKKLRRPVRIPRPTSPAASAASLQTCRLWRRDRP